jgi:hypothetical protein
MTADRIVRLLSAAYRRIEEHPHALEIIERIQCGEIGCCACGHVGMAGAFREKRGRRYCPNCGACIDDQGWVDGDFRAPVAEAVERVS